MPADGMTKMLPRQKHVEFLRQLHRQHAIQHDPQINDVKEINDIKNITSTDYSYNPFITILHIANVYVLDQSQNFVAKPI